MASVAENANVLSRRVRYFVKAERAKDSKLAKLLDEIATPAYLFGGVVRDLALYGKRDLANREVDIDVVCAARGRQADRFFERLAEDHNVARNRFGGFRLTTRRWNVDVWAAEDTWAFRQGKFRYESVESLLETTITSWEAILFRLDGGPLTCKSSYFKDIQNGLLDVIFGDNPNPLGMYVRLMRACVDWPVSHLSERAREVVADALRTYSFDDLKSYEQEHYRRRYIDELAYERVATVVRNGGSRGVGLAAREGVGQIFHNQLA